jgi:hypothetical protein
MNSSAVEGLKWATGILSILVLLILFLIWRRNSHICIPRGHILISNRRNFELDDARLADKLDEIRRQIPDCYCDINLVLRANQNLEKFILENGKMINFEIMDMNKKTVIEDGEMTPRELLEIYLANASNLIRTKRTKGFVDLELLKSLVGEKTYTGVDVRASAQMDIFEKITGKKEEETTSTIKIPIPYESREAQERSGFRVLPPVRSTSGISEAIDRSGSLSTISDTELMKQTETRHDKIIDMPCDERIRLMGM